MSEEPSDFKYSQKSLEEDAYAQADPITNYPNGISIMPVTAANAFMGDDVDQTITTHRTGSIGVQWAASDEYEAMGHRYFSGGAWGQWTFYALRSSVDAVYDSIQHIVPMIQDAFAEADPITDYPEGISNMPVSDTADFGPNTGEAGLITTKSTGVEGVQILEAYNGSEYKRSYTSGSWGAWAEGGGGGDATSIVSLPEDSRAFDDPPTAYPLGFSVMSVMDDSAPGTWGWEWDFGTLTTHYFLADADDHATQVLFSDTSGWPSFRRWRADFAEWSDFQSPSLGTHNHNDLYYTKAEIDAMLA